MNPRTRLHRSQDTPQGLHQTQGSSWRPKSAILNSKLVGGPGFEPGASRSRTVRAAKLRQPPTRVILPAWVAHPRVGGGPEGIRTSVGGLGSISTNATGHKTSR